MIAIVDDDESVGEATKSLVRSLGHDGRVFGSAEAFLRSKTLHKTNCVISDIQMPGIDGEGLQQRLMALRSDLPMIFITAYPDSGTRERTLSCGAFGYLPKPFDDNALIACIEKALARTR